LPRWLSVSQTAALAQTSPKTIYRYIENGILPAVRVGPRFLRIESDAVLNLLSPSAPEGQHHAAPEKTTAGQRHAAPEKS
jgi:excisionase family DNA binding protein